MFRRHSGSDKRSCCSRRRLCLFLDEKEDTQTFLKEKEENNTTANQAANRVAVNANNLEDYAVGMLSDDDSNDSMLLYVTKKTGFGLLLIEFDDVVRNIKLFQRVYDV